MEEIVKIFRFVLITVLLVLVFAGINSVAYADDGSGGGDAPETINSFTLSPNPAYVGQAVTYTIQFDGSGGTRNTICLYYQDGTFQAPIDGVGDLTSGLGDTYIQEDGSGSPESTTNCGGVSGYYVNEWTVSTANGFLGGGDQIQFTIIIPNTSTGNKMFISQQYNTGLINTLNTTLTIDSSSTIYIGNASADCGGNSPCYTGTSALQDAINALPSPGGTVIVGGQYRSGGANVSTQDVTLQPLDSAAELRADGSCGGGAPIVLNSSGNLTIDGLTLNGTGAPAGCSDGVLVTGSSSGDLAFQNSAVATSWASDGVEISSGASGSFSFSNSTFSNNGSDGISAEGTVSVADCTFSGNTTNGVSVNSGTATIEDSVFSSNGYGVYLNSGTLTLSGNDFDSNTNYGFTVAGGSAVAYANNFSGNNGGGFQAYVQDLNDAAKNWWGSYSNSSVGPTTDNTNSYAAGWDARLGSDVEDWESGNGSATLGNAAMSGGSGTAVIIDLGRASSNAPFGNGVPPYVNQACSPFYDFYDLDGGTETWTVQLPIDTSTDCVSNVRNNEVAFYIPAGTYDTDCNTANNPACWDRIDASAITVDGDNLLISMSGNDLSGTHIVGGDSSGAYDPTLITLESVSASSSSNPWVPFGLLVASVALVSGMVAYLRKREA